MSKDLEDLATISKTSGKLAVRWTERLLDKVMDVVDKKGQKVVENIQDEKDNMPDNYSATEKTGAFAGRVLGKGIGKLGKLARKGYDKAMGQETDPNANPMRCYEARFKKGGKKDLCIRMDEKNVLVVWQNEGKLYAAVDTSFDGHEQIVESCKVQLKKEVSLDHYLRHLVLQDNDQKS